MTSARELAAISSASLARPLTHDLELLLGEPGEPEVVRGAFDRGAVKRGSGGGPWTVAPGTLWLQLAIRRAIVDETRILNRYVRPLLAALTRLGPPARYFGRDWVSVESRPSAGVGFAFDAATGRALFEAILPCASAFSEPGRGSFIGKAPRVLGVSIEAATEKVRAAYEALGATLVDVAAPSSADAEPEPAWEITVADAIGEVCAGRDARGIVRLGGEIMGSRQSVAALERGESGWLLGTRTETALAVLAEARHLPR